MKFQMLMLQLTHSRWEDHDTEDVHAFTGARKRSEDHIGRWRQFKGEVLDVCAIVILDSINEVPSGGGLLHVLTDGGSRLHDWDAFCAILQFKYNSLLRWHIKQIYSKSYGIQYQKYRVILNITHTHAHILKSYDRPTLIIILHVVAEITILN